VRFEIIAIEEEQKASKMKLASRVKGLSHSVQGRWELLAVSSQMQMDRVLGSMHKLALAEADCEKLDQGSEQNQKRATVLAKILLAEEDDLASLANLTRACELKATVEEMRSDLEHLSALAVRPGPSKEDAAMLAVWVSRLKRVARPQKGFDRSVTYGVIDTVKIGWERANALKEMTDNAIRERVKLKQPAYLDAQNRLAHGKAELVRLENETDRLSSSSGLASAEAKLSEVWCRKLFRYVRSPHTGSLDIALFSRFAQSYDQNMTETKLSALIERLGFSFVIKDRMGGLRHQPKVDFSRFGILLGTYVKEEPRLKEGGGNRTLYRIVVDTCVGILRVAQPLVLAMVRSSCRDWASRILTVYDVNGDGVFDEEEFIRLYQRVLTVKGSGEEASNRCMEAAGAQDGRLNLEGFMCFLDMQYGNLSETNFEQVALRLIEDASQMKAMVATGGRSTPPPSDTVPPRGPSPPTGGSSITPPGHPSSAPPPPEFRFLQSEMLSREQFVALQEASARRLLVMCDLDGNHLLSNEEWLPLHAALFDRAMETKEEQAHSLRIFRQAGARSPGPGQPEYLDEAGVARLLQQVGPSYKNGLEGEKAEFDALVLRGLAYATQQTAEARNKEKVKKAQAFQKHNGARFVKLRRKAAKQLMSCYDVDDNDVLDPDEFHSLVRALYDEPICPRQATDTAFYEAGARRHAVLGIDILDLAGLVTFLEQCFGAGNSTSLSIDIFQVCVGGRKLPRKRPLTHTISLCVFPLSLCFSSLSVFFLSLCVFPLSSLFFPLFARLQCSVH